MNLQSDNHDAHRYNQVRRVITIVDVAVTIAMLVVLLVTGWSERIHDLTIRVTGGSNYVAALFVYVLILTLIAKAVSLPLEWYAFRVEHRFQLSNQRLGSWLWDECKGLLVGFAISSLLAQLFYLFVRKMPVTWWIATWAVFLVLYVVLAQLAPVLLFPIFYRFKPLDNEALRERLTRLGERAGTKVRGVYEWKLSEKSKKANAALMGLGQTRRIVLADTLLEGYTDDEIEAVLAHELGHHVRNHIVKSVVVHAGVSLAMLWVIKWQLRQPHPWFDGQTDFANLPFVVLITTVLSLVLLPLLNAYSRYNERQADVYAWKSVASVGPFISAMNKLAGQNLAERQPARWVEVLFHSHPSIARRIAAAEKWAKSSREA